MIITCRLVAADHQIKLQILSAEAWRRRFSDTTHLIIVFVPKETFTRIVQEYWDNMVIVQGKTRPDGSIHLQKIRQAA